jgi:hypothetical protein
LKVDLGEFPDLGVENGEAALFLEAFSVIGEGDIRPLGQECPSEFEGEGQPPKQAADNYSLAAFRMLGVFEDDPARVVAEE